MNYIETIDYLFSKLPNFERVGQLTNKIGLEKITQLCEALGNPQNTFKSIHIGGTNGKGSTSHLLSAVLQSAGYKTGLHTSPHLKSYTERFKINGLAISENEVVEFVETHKTLIEQVKPSFFEISVALAFYYFAQQKVDIAIVEVGLGGRLDSTNIIKPILSIITNISYDHIALLGDTLDKIAYEKAGIIKPNTPIVISEYQSEIADIFIEKAQKAKSKIYFANRHYSIIILNINPKSGRREVEVLDMERNEKRHYELDLLGQYQSKNLSAVIQAIDVLKEQGFSIKELDIYSAFYNCCLITNFKGRWQVLQHLPIVVADVAHNAAGLSEVLEQIDSYEYNRLHFVIGFVKDKDIEKIMRLFPKTAQYYFCDFSSFRALPSSELQNICENIGLFGKTYETPNLALSAAKENASKSDFIYVGGSTFVLSDVNEI